MSRADLDQAVLDAADRLVALREAELDAQHRGLDRLSSPHAHAPTRAAVLAAEKMLERAVLARRAAR